MLALIVNNPRAGSWIVFFFYFIVAMICARAFRVSWIGSRMAAEYPSEERRAKDRKAAYRASFLFWGVTIAIFVFLGINRQIDMQTWITSVGRRIARAQGWYEQRAKVQTVFVLVVAITALGAQTVLLKLTRDLLPRHVLAFFGLSLLAINLLLRASSFHDVDAAMMTEILGIRIGWILELAGIACVATCAVANYWWHRRLPAAAGAQPPQPAQNLHP